MARHSKWHKVRQFKGAIDAKRSASFTRLAREITVAVREKGSDPGMNVQLRVAIDHAKKASMPKENIERAIQRGTGVGGEGQLETLTYEAYAPGGTAMIIEGVTDNRNRTAKDVKHLLSEHGGTLAASGSVTYLFDRKAVVHLAMMDHRDEVELAFIDAGAEAMEDREEGADVIGDAHGLGSLADVATKFGLVIESAELEWIPRMLVDVEEEHGRALAELVDALEEMDDVSRVYTNAA